MIVIALFGGNHDHGADHDMSHEADHGVDSEHGSEFINWLPFLSLRFWTYFAAAFGVIGTLLTFLRLGDSNSILVTSLISGFLMGVAVWGVMKWVQVNEVGRSVQTDDLLGKTARVIVACRPGQLGKIRLDVRGDMIDMMATDEEDQTLHIGEEIVITRIEKSVAYVLTLRSALEQGDNPQ